MFYMIVKFLPFISVLSWQCSKCSTVHQFQVSPSSSFSFNVQVTQDQALLKHCITDLQASLKRCITDLQASYTGSVITLTLHH